MLTGLVPVGRDLDHLAVAHIQVEVAAHAAIGARGRDFRRLPGASLAMAVLLRQCTRRTNGDALSAKDAVALLQAGVKRGGYLGAKAAVDHRDGVDRLDLVAGADAAATADALLHVPDDKGVAVVKGILVLFAHEGGLFDAVLVDQILQLAVAAHLAGHAVLGMVGEEQLQHEFAGRADLGGFGLHLHPFGDRKGAGGLQNPRALDLYQAEAARPFRGQRRMVAEGRNADAVRPGNVKDGAAGGLNLLSIDG